MVVLAASIVNKSGKVLVSREFVDMSRLRIEGLLAAFPKLLGIGKQHTYVETENVRYVYQPLEALYLLLVTNKQSNILQDLDTLRILSKLVPEYSYSLDEESILKATFDLLFAFDEVISLGHKENVTLTQVKQYCEMESLEEELHKEKQKSKIEIAKNKMIEKAMEIEKNKVGRNRGADRGGSLSSIDSGRFESNFSDVRISGKGSGFGLKTDVDSTSIKSEGRQPSPATAPPKGRGMQLGKSKRTNQFLESLKAEGEDIHEDVQPKGGQARSVSVATQPTDSITLTIEEKLSVILKRDGGISNFDVQGTLLLQILNPEDGLIQVPIEHGGNPGVIFKTHPHMNKELFSKENILGLKDPNRPFPSGQAGEAGVGLLKWRMQNDDESMVPLTINCWPSVSGSETYVSIEYEASSLFDLRNVVISVPLPALREAPTVRQVDGEWRYDSRSSILEWSIVLIDNSNRSGSMEFVLPPADSSAFFPIHVRFTAANTYSDLKVANVLPLKGGPSPKFSQRVQLVADNYQVV